MVRNPMSHDLPASLREHEGPKQTKRPSIERAIASTGFNLQELVELQKTHPELLLSIRDQLSHFIENGATQQEIEEYFRNQADISRAIAEASKGEDWKDKLKQIKDRLPKAN